MKPRNGRKDRTERVSVFYALPLLARVDAFARKSGIRRATALSVLLARGVAATPPGEFDPPAAEGAQPSDSPGGARTYLPAPSRAYAGGGEG